VPAAAPEPRLSAGDPTSALPLGARRLLGEFLETTGDLLLPPAPVVAEVGDPRQVGASRSPTLPLDPWVMARLLEDGDGADLRWLCRELPEETLAAWLDHHGVRRLSRRSLAFWSVLLGRGGPPADLAATLVQRHALWPL
jgi:hypothetical protein